MTSLRRLLLLGASVLALAGSACLAADTGGPGSDLNPQPLPPGQTGDDRGTDDGANEEPTAGAADDGGADAQADGSPCADAAADAGADAGCEDP